MENAGEERDLRLVRHELDMLDHARLVAELRPEDEVRYRELCRIERELLGRECQVLGKLVA